MAWNSLGPHCTNCVRTQVNFGTKWLCPICDREELDRMTAAHEAKERQQ